MNRRAFVTLTSAGALGLSLRDLGAAPDTLYNGIRLTDPWPPQHRAYSTRPITPPYLADPPPVIPIDVGRQLFVDDFLIEQTSLTRTFHRAEYHPGNPIVRPLTRWERYDEAAVRTNTRSNPAAMVFSDGVFFDPRDRLFKMWYMGGYGQHTCYATSSDGIAWERPQLDVVSGTNIVWSGLRDSSTVWLDQETPDPRQRYKMSVYNGSERRLLVYTSADGIHWGDTPVKSGPTGDRTTFFYNPFRKVWVFSLRDLIDGRWRARRYWEAPDFVAGCGWREGQPVRWISSDTADLRRADYRIDPELYNLDCVAYESLLLGLFTIFRGERDDREKPNEVCIGYSRDGFHWARPDRAAFIPVSEHVGDWNWANVQSAGGCCLIVGDRLYFYVSGRSGVPGSNSPGVCATGLATLRRDGFVSMDHPGSPAAVQRIDLAEGLLVTRPVQFSGQHLFVNADLKGGELRVEVLDREGRVIAPYAASACTPLTSDSTAARVSWRSVRDLAPLAGRSVRFRFHLARGRLYAFWVARSDSGASGGYVAAGGPAFRGPVDGVAGAGR